MMNRAFWYGFCDGAAKACPFAWAVAIFAAAYLLTGCAIRDDFGGTERKVTSYSIYREGFYDEGGPIVLRVYREGETGGPLGVQREAIR